MRIPTEGELIEMQAKFDVLVEMANDLEKRSENYGGDRRDQMESDAFTLREVSELADSLLDLVRSQMAVPR